MLCLLKASWQDSQQVTVFKSWIGSLFSCWLLFSILYRQRLICFCWYSFLVFDILVNLNFLNRWNINMASNVKSIERVYSEKYCSLPILSISSTSDPCRSSVSLVFGLPLLSSYIFFVMRSIIHTYTHTHSQSSPTLFDFIGSILQ